MGYYYIDDSVHERAGFILCAVVYSARGITSRTTAALRTAGLVPGRDEFKSGARMQGQPALAELRNVLLRIIHEKCRVGVVVAPCTDRAQLGSIVLDGLAWIISANRFVRSPGEIFIDQGMFRSNKVASQEAAARPELANKTLHAEQDSRQIVGIQLADLAAHTCATMLLAQLGYVSKTVKAGENSGYDPAMDLELEFSLWASLRYSLFRQGDPSRPLDDPVMDATPGLYIAPTCSPSLQAAAFARFSTVYLGCIH